MIPWIFKTDFTDIENSFSLRLSIIICSVVFMFLLSNFYCFQQQWFIRAIIFLIRDICYHYLLSRFRYSTSLVKLWLKAIRLSNLIFSVRNFSSGYFDFQASCMASMDWLIASLLNCLLSRL